MLLAWSIMPRLNIDDPIVPTEVDTLLLMLTPSLVAILVRRVVVACVIAHLLQLVQLLLQLVVPVEQVEGQAVVPLAPVGCAGQRGSMSHDGAL